MGNALSILYTTYKWFLVTNYSDPISVTLIVIIFLSLDIYMR
jgi:hypothetical protein